MAAFEVRIYSDQTLVWRARVNASDERAVRSKAFELMDQGGGYKPELLRLPRGHLRVAVESLDTPAPWPELA